MSPTTLKLENLFANAVIPQELSDVTVYNTNANSNDRTMTVTVCSQKLIPYDIIEEFKSYIKQKYALNQFLLKVKYLNTSVSELGVDEYYKNLVFYVNEVINGVRHLFLDSIARLMENTLYISCRYGTDMLHDMKCGETISRIILAQTGENISVVFEDDSVEGELEKALEETLENLPVIEAPAPKEEVKEEKTETDVLYGREIKEEAVAISDISPDARFIVYRGL